MKFFRFHDLCLPSYGFNDARKALSALWFSFFVDRPFLYLLSSFCEIFIQPANSGSKT